MKFIRRSGSCALRRMLVVGVVLACPAHQALAVMKCVDSAGRVTFQDVLCDNASTSVPLRPRPAQVSAETPPARARMQASLPSTSAKALVLR